MSKDLHTVCPFPPSRRTQYAKLFLVHMCGDKMMLMACRRTSNPFVIHLFRLFRLRSLNLQRTSTISLKSHWAGRAIKVIASSVCERPALIAAGETTQMDIIVTVLIRYNDSNVVMSIVSLRILCAWALDNTDVLIPAYIDTSTVVERALILPLL
eukprot:1315651-Amorphochlora_amoeboformis.AAC.1